MADFTPTSIPNLSYNGKNYRMNGKIISTTDAQKMLTKTPAPAKASTKAPAPSGNGVKCPDGFESIVRDPNCGVSNNPNKCKKTMWGKPVNYCKKLKSEK